MISDVDYIHSRFCILLPSPAIKDAEEINARVVCYIETWIVKKKKKDEVILKTGTCYQKIHFAEMMTISVGSFSTGTCSISKVSDSRTGIEIEAFSQSLVSDFSK